MRKNLDLKRRAVSREIQLLRIHASEIYDGDRLKIQDFVCSEYRTKLVYYKFIGMPGIRRLLVWLEKTLVFDTSI